MGEAGELSGEDVGIDERAHRSGVIGNEHDGSGSFRAEQEVVHKRICLCSVEAMRLRSQAMVRIEDLEPVDEVADEPRRAHVETWD